MKECRYVLRTVCHDRLFATHSDEDEAEPQRQGVLSRRLGTRENAYYFSDTPQLAMWSSIQLKLLDLFEQASFQSPETRYDPIIASASISTIWAGRARADTSATVMTGLTGLKNSEYAFITSPAFLISVMYIRTR